MIEFMIEGDPFSIIFPNGFVFLHKKSEEIFVCLREALLLSCEIASFFNIWLKREVMAPFLRMFDVGTWKSKGTNMRPEERIVTIIERVITESYHRVSEAEEI